MYIIDAIVIDNTFSKRCTCVSNARKDCVGSALRKISSASTASFAMISCRSPKPSRRSLNVRGFCSVRFAQVLWAWWWHSPREMIPTRPSTFTIIVRIASGTPWPSTSRVKISIRYLSSSTITRDSIWFHPNRLCTKSSWKSTNTIKMSTSKMKRWFLGRARRPSLTWSLRFAKEPSSTSCPILRQKKSSAARNERRRLRSFPLLRRYTTWRSRRSCKRRPSRVHTMASR